MLNLKTDIIFIVFNFNSYFLFVFLDEIKREREFYRVRGLPCPKDIPQIAGELEEEKPPNEPTESDYHRQDEQVNCNVLFFYFLFFN